jgi:transcriptional regulator with XRE-family HTH domain
MDLAERIKAIRKAKGIPPSVIAKELGIEPTNYPRLENRGNKLTYEYIEKIAAALGITVVELLTWKENNVATTAESDDVGQLKKQIEELRDRMNDKQKIAELYENELLKVDLVFADYLWDLINDNAIFSQVGNVELTYSNPERVVKIPMTTYVESLKGESDFDDSYDMYGIELTDSQVRSIFYKLLKSKPFKDLIASLHRNNMIQDKTLHNLFTDYQNSNSRLPKSNSNRH